MVFQSCGATTPHAPHTYGRYNHDTGENETWQCPGVSAPPRPSEE